VGPSEVNHIMRGGSSVLLLHGADDDSVPISQSLDIVRRYREAGANPEVYMLLNAPHAFWNYRPWFSEAIERATTFFLSLTKEQNTACRPKFSRDTGVCVLPQSLIPR